MQNIKQIFAANLKRRRLALDMTQKQLANLIGYSDKAISKWELGETVAPGEILPALAKQLGTSVDELLTGTKNQKYYLGIDGGGSKTEFALAGSDGKIIRSLILGASNPVDIGMAQALDVLNNGIRQVCSDVFFSDVHVFAGIAGGITGDNRKRISDFLSRFGFASYDNGSDARNAVASCLGDSDGMTVIIGTGNILFSQINGKLSRIDGYGYLFDEGACGYTFGRNAIIAALKNEVGTGEDTVITKILKERLGTDTVLENLSKWYQGGKREIASYASVVFEAYRQDDNAAKQIVQKAVGIVAAHIEGAARQFDNDKKSMWC